MRTSIYNKVLRLFALLFVSGAMMAEVKAQENLHLFYKAGEHEKIALTRDTKVEFVKRPYLKEISYSADGDTIFMSANAGRTDMYGAVQSNVPWTVSADADWLMVRQDKLPDWFYPLGDGMMESCFLVFAEPNVSDEARCATVTVGAGNGLAKTFVVYQHPYTLSLKYLSRTMGFDAELAKSETISWNDTVYYAVVYPNHGVEQVEYPDWMTLDSIVSQADYCKFEDIAKISDSVRVTNEPIGGGATYACFHLTENRTPDERKGEIIFKAHGQTAVLTVTQEGITDATSLATLEEMQHWMVKFGIASTSHDDFSHMSVLHAADMMAEDMTMFNSSWFNFDYELGNNAATYRRSLVNWETYYGLVNRANAVIDFIDDVKELVSNEDFVLGNAYAYRAMAYLYLIQLFQNPTTADGIDESLPGVPLLFAVTEQKEIPSEQVEYFKGRNTVGEVMAQIEADITQAIELLEGEVRPSKNYIDVTVAQGIAARYYLLVQEWEQAAVMANAARNGYRLMEGNTETNGIRDGFMDITNEEWMWGFDQTIETQTTYASFFSHISNLADGYSGIGYTGRGVDARLFDRMSTVDYRRAYWYRDVNGNTESTAAASPNAYICAYPYAILKFGWKEDWTQDYIYMRAAEMVLIEAEALARQQKSVEAAAVLAELMAQRDPSWNQSDVTVEDVYLQRRLELIGEGHAYFDLKRLNRGIERNYEGSNHLEGYKLNVTAENDAWVYEIPQRAINDDRTYNLSAEDNLFVQNLEALYIYGDAVGVESITDLSGKFIMADGVNELTNMLREGMCEKYIVLEAGKEFRLVGNNEGVIIPIGANLEAYDVSELADNPTLATVMRGDLVVGEEAPAMMVDKTGLYHIILDLHLDDDLMRPQIVIADVQWGVRGAMNGWGFTAFDEVEVDANSMTWTMENVEMPANGEFKFAYGSGWKLQLDDAGSVKANTCLGMYSQPNGANIKVDKAGLYTITLTYTLNSGSVADSYTFTTMCTQVLPTELYIIGEEFGYWDWSSDGVVAMIPVHSQAGAFWTTRYFTAGAGFKFCPQREWKGDFSSLDNNYGYIEDGNCYVEEDGFYTIYVDLANSVIAVEPAAVYGMGDCFGGWDIDVEENKFVAEGTTLVSPATVSEGNIRMYAAAPSVIEGVDWWQMEFNVYDGIIVYRGAGSDQEPVSVPEGYQVTLDLNAGIGSIAEPGVEQAYLQEISYTDYNNDTIFMSASAGRTNTYGHVQCNYPWTVTPDADWLLARVNESDNYDGAFSGEYAYENIFMLYASANDTDQERVGHVTISTEQNVSKTFVVVQRPYTLSFNEEAYRNDLRFDGEPVDTFVIEGAWDWTNVYYNLLPNHGVEVTSYPDWMVQDGYEFGGEACSFDNILAAEDILNAGIPIVTTVSFSFERNESPEPREAHIIFEGNGQKAVGIFRQEGCNEQAIINQAGTLAKRLYLFDEALGMSRHNDFGFPSLMLTMDGRGMDLVADNSGYNWFGHSLNYSDLGSNLIYTAMYWTSMYNHIHASNEVIRAYGDRADQSIFQFYLGQAYAFRAFNYFYLAQLYQQTYVGNEDAPCVPIISEENMDAVSDEGCPRATVREVYDFILSDLAKSLQLLEQTEIGRPGKHLVSPEVIYGLRARINMVRGEWQAAAEDARRVIDADVSTPYTMDEVSKPTFNDINHAAWLWGIDVAEDDSPVVTAICNWPSHMGSFSSGYAQFGVWRKVSQSLYEAIPTSDVRKGWFLNANTESANLSAEQAEYVAEYFMPAYTQVKFAPYNDELGVSTNASDIPLLRIEEMYLILAEAQAMLGNAAEAAATLNAFVSTYRDPEYSCSAGASAEELLDAIWMQRRIELWGEGHSYFDLMRMKKGVDRRGAGFQPEYVYHIAAGDAALIYPIPDREMAANAQLVQNPVAEQPQAVASGAGASSGLYMIGQDFGNWDWSSDGVVAMIPVHSHEGAFWTTRYFTAGAGFKFCTQREWSGDFFSLESNYGFTMNGGNCYVDEDGFYTIYVDLANSVIAVEPAAVYGIGDCFGGWNIDVEENKFVAQGDQLVSPVFVADGEVRMYVAPPSVIPGFDWWMMEFNVYDGTIVYRGTDTDQERVNGLAGQKVTLNLNAGTGSIGESEVEQAVSTLKLFLSVEDVWGGDFVMPVSTEGTEDTEDTGNAEAGADTIRYIVRMWPVDDAAAWTEQVYYSTSPDGYIEVDTTLAEGIWAVAVWADRLYGTDSPHYSFEGALVRANTENYVGATDAKDGFCYYEEVKLYGYEVAVREMVLYRPLAKCEYVAMDMEDFLLSEAERLGLESPSDVALEDYTVRVSYEGFLPIEYDRATLRNTDSATGVSYECGITMLDDGTALLASDYILCEQSQTLVSFHIAVMYEDGTIVYQKDLQHVLLKSNYCTQIEGALVEDAQASR